MTPNPFKYGTVVTGKDFVGRKKELKILYQELSAGKSVVLFSDRRLGKTSLLTEFISRKKRGMIPVYIDLYGLTTKEDLVKEIAANVIGSAYTKLNKLKEAAKKVLSGLRPKLVLEPDGKISLDLEFDGKFNDAELMEILDLPQKVAADRNSKVIMIFDEFQEIGVMDGIALEKLMRSRFQHHKNVSYIFAGSREHLLRQMFEEPAGAFFKFARPMELGPISHNEFRPFITDKFKETGGKPDKTIINKILEYTGGNPYITQYLCHEIWYITKSPKWPEVIDAALDNIVAQQSVAYEHIWDSLKSTNQRALLMAIVSESRCSYSHEFINKYNLKSQSHVEKSIKSLKARSIIDSKGEITDQLFKEWLVRRIIKD
jgi:AAA+ ATPase superfamily predicted ATPase